MTKVRLLISPDTAYLIENADQIRPFCATAKPEVLATVRNELAYVAAMAQNLVTAMDKQKQTRRPNIDLAEALGHGVTRLHCHGFGWADVAAKSTPDGWDISVQRTTFRDQLALDAVVAEFRATEGL